MKIKEKRKLVLDRYLKSGSLVPEQCLRCGKMRAENDFSWIFICCLDKNEGRLDKEKEYKN